MTARERFNSELADTAVNFIRSELTHTEGEYVGRPVEPMAWQEDTFRTVIGTQVYSDEFDEWIRRYNTVYIEVARKNGKSFWLSAAAIYHLMSDPTLRGQDIVCVACDSEQATIVFETAANMIEANPELEKRCRIAKRSHKRIENLKNGNRLFVIPGDADGALGLRPAVIMFDELLAQKKRALFDALTTGQGSARQPLLYMITTAGEYGTLCHEQMEYGQKVAAGQWDDPSFLFVRYGMDDGDDWRDESTWKKANPGLGISPTMTYLRSKFRKAEHSLAEQIAFRKFYLNEWNLSETSWLDMAAWDDAAGHIDLDDCKGLPVYIGVDLSSRLDLTAVVATFKSDDGYKVIPRFFLPEEGIDEKARRDGVPYRQWADRGFLTLTPGRTILISAVYRSILDFASVGSPAEVGYDQHNAADLEAQLDESGIPAFDVPQGFWLSESLKDCEAALLDKRITHDGNPVMRWCAGNAIVKMNDVARIRLVKKVDTKRIDGISALADCFDRIRRHETPTESVYETRGLLTL